MKGPKYSLFSSEMYIFVMCVYFGTNNKKYNTTYARHSVYVKLLLMIYLINYCIYKLITKDIKNRSTGNKLLRPYWSY